jgi:hypothetical protein
MDGLPKAVDIITEGGLWQLHAQWFILYRGLLTERKKREKKSLDESI